MRAGVIEFTSKCRTRLRLPMASALQNPRCRLRFPLTLAVAAALFIPLLGRQARAAGSAKPQRTPVLVELFTSLGCSDCPPADALLARLDATQFVPGAEAIVLSEHVTYWNHQGWSDPFSLQAVDERQVQYKWYFSLQDVYTPEMVVDGRWQFVGSNLASLSRDVATAAATPKLSIQIAGAQLSGREVRFSVQSRQDLDANLIAAVADSSATTSVSGGENAGHTLQNVAVVRVLRNFGSKAEGRPLHLSLPAANRNSKGQSPLHLIVFLARRSDGHVIAIAEQNLSH